MGIRRLLVTTVTALLLLPASVAVAQDESPAPDPLAALADSVFAEVFPTELGGLPWDDITVQAGAEGFEDDDDEDRADIEALLEELGATVDDLATANASRFSFSEESSEYALISAFQVSGVDAARLLEALLPRFVEDLEEPMQEDGQVAGKDVVIVYDAASDVFFGEAQPLHMYASGETVWIVSAAEPALTEAFDKLP